MDKNMNMDGIINNDEDIERIQSIEVEIEEILKAEDEKEEVIHQVIEIAAYGNDNSTDVKISNENSPLKNNLEETKEINKSKVPNINTETVVSFTGSTDSNSNKANQTKVSKCTDKVVPQRSEAQIDEHMLPPITQKSNVQLFTEDTGPQLYNAKGSLVSAPIITKNLPKVFEYLPVYGKPKDKKKIKEFFRSKIREFVGCDLSDNDFSQLEDYCSPEHLKIGKEMVLDTNIPVMGVVAGNIIRNLNDDSESHKAPNLCILKKNKMRIEKDTKGLFTKKLKYRGVRILPYTQEGPSIYQMTADAEKTDLEPGKDVLYRVRVYRPYTYTLAKDRFTRTRHSVFCCDIILTGRHKLSDLRDRIVCHNDFDMRVDVSNHPDMLPNTKAKEVFPSGFLFINNVFYVDTREGCIDYSAPIRRWATERKLGDFPKKDMCTVKLEELVLKLGYPEVYVHQGHCEHVFLFSEIRLLSPTDPLGYNNYPCSTAIAQNQTVYCTTCAEFSAKWIVTGCNRVPFDPAFFCETCFKQYLYKDGQKIGEFKAYSYRGNALNVLKPQRRGPL